MSGANEAHSDGGERLGQEKSECDEIVCLKTLEPS